ncbi:MAG: DUF3800 domain-containing protein [Defluviitaleaceae bacterium]|nr:DUF3800 domain-containing protein [Defluviitaleaceae bacterium]
MEYFLFLDESKPGGYMKYFCFAGLIIGKNEYVNEVIPKTNKLKLDVFGKTDIILHETDIRKASGDFACMINANTRETFWRGMHSIFNESDMKTVGACVSGIIKDIYNSENVNSYYHIALQIILENFAYFLEQNSAKGSVIIESTTSDKQITNLYHTIVSNGTLFLGRNIYQKHLTTISFSIKQDNNLGLQLADFVPNPINREASGLKQKPHSLNDIIKAKMYDGGIGEKDRFGLKMLG